MAKIEFPKPLKALLEDSDLQAPIRTLADRVGEILADNKLPFFPDYTDHGTGHINAVLKTEVELVPKAVWESSKADSDPRLLGDADAALIIGGTLLHDLAMHLHPQGFRELVSTTPRFKPLAWFHDNHEGHRADRPWAELWQDYEREARRFSERDLTNIIGEQSARSWKFDTLPGTTGEWELNHFLVVGEFIRRHHARLAHEIAMHGFPGVPVGTGEGQFPAMGADKAHPLCRLADLIGLVARSHGTSLRVCKSYIEASPIYPGTPKPMDAAVYYPMALLRIADYLQIDRQRAPAVLLQLRDPQSPVSIQEWEKHRAVQAITAADDPRGRMVTVSTDLSLSLYLQLRELISGVQAEMDHSTAVLDEAYGTLTELGLNQLCLATRRVYSNLQSPAFRDGLPYVPERTGFTADPNILTLLVEPLYGNHPGVGVRELVQNAADAVRERDAWCAGHNVDAASLKWPDQEADVLVEFVKRENGSWLLRVTDKGVGMQADTIQNYFLRAGASFRRSAEWAKEFVDESGKPRVIRAGRFGIGAFAVFLLGPSFRMKTRHVSSSPQSMGSEIQASANCQVIEVKRVSGLPMGTTIEVDISAEAVAVLRLDEKKYSDRGPAQQVDWYCWDWPVVVTQATREGVTMTLDAGHASPIRPEGRPVEWSVIHPEGFDAVYWTFAPAPDFSCNGIKIQTPGYPVGSFNWPSLPLEPPKIAVVDALANLPLTTQRYELSGRLPFLDDLVRDVLLSFIAYSLLRGPSSRASAILGDDRYPLERRSAVGCHSAPEGFGIGALNLRPISTRTHVVPADPWLNSLLNCESSIVYGAVSDRDVLDRLTESMLPFPVAQELMAQTDGLDSSVMDWFGFLGDSPSRLAERLPGFARHVFSLFSEQGVPGLGQELEWGVVLSTPDLVSDGGESGPPGYGERFGEAALQPTGAPEHWASNGRTFRRFGARNASLSLDLERLVKIVEKSLGDHPWRGSGTFVSFAAELKVKQSPRTPETPLATIWNECLGPAAIPFDAAARRALIAKGREHQGLRRHLDAWEAMRAAEEPNEPTAPAAGSTR